MTAPLVVLAACLLFVGTHLILGATSLRARLAQHFGEARFVAIFSAVAALTLTVMAWVTAATAGEGPANPLLVTGRISRVFLILFASMSLWLAVAAIAVYPRSPMALLRRSFASPNGVQRITRHGFFVGFGLFAAAHAMLVTTLATAIYFISFALIALFGAVWQDRKLLERHGEPYAAFMRSTSIWPFAAILRGRQALHRPNFKALVLSLTLTILISALHPVWSYAGGAPFVAALALGGYALSYRRWTKPR
jgi:uncharacterized membrane protein